MKRFLTTCCGLLLLAVGNVATADIVLIHDQYLVVTPDSTSVFAGSTFRSENAYMGVNPINYTVNAGSVFPMSGTPGSVIFFGAQTTDSDMFFAFSTEVGREYSVSFDVGQFGDTTTHTIGVSAIDGVGLGGSLLGSSGAIGINSSGTFDFTATGTAATLRMLGTLGSNNANADIAFRNLKVTTVPEPGAGLMFGAALLGLVTCSRRRRR